MSKPYMTVEVHASGKKHMDTVKIDLRRFAIDLSRELGGALYQKPNNDYPHENQYVSVGKDRLHIRADTYKRKIHVYIEAPDVKWDDRDQGDSRKRTESASINPDGRALSTIAKDIKRRVIDASQGALALQRVYAAKQTANRSAIVEHMAALQATCPALRVTRQDDKAQTAQVYGSGDLYLSARLEANGAVYIDRMGNMSAEKFARIVAIYNEKA